jgi:hypothetical protein
MPLMGDMVAARKSAARPGALRGYDKSHRLAR